MEFSIVWPIVSLLVTLIMFFNGLNQEGLIRYAFFIAGAVALVMGVTVLISKRWKGV